QMNTLHGGYKLTDCCCTNCVISHCQSRQDTGNKATQKEQNEICSPGSHRHNKLFPKIADRINDYANESRFLFSKTEKQHNGDGGQHWLCNQRKTAALAAENQKANSNQHN